MHEFALLCSLYTYIAPFVIFVIGGYPHLYAYQGYFPAAVAHSITNWPLCNLPTAIAEGDSALQSSQWRAWLEYLNFLLHLRRMGSPYTLKQTHPNLEWPALMVTTCLRWCRMPSHHKRYYVNHFYRVRYDLCLKTRPCFNHTLPGLADQTGPI